MEYRTIGLMSGSSLDGIDIAFVNFHESAGAWTYELKASDCYAYDKEWKEKLQSAAESNARDYLLTHSSYGRFLGEQVNRFISENKLEYQVQLIASHGHTIFHVPSKKMTSQLGDGSQIAAITGLNVVSDLRSMDIALGGQGAPIVPIGEKLLFSDYELFLNLGGIANLSHNGKNSYIAFDVCPANRVLNLLAKNSGLDFDENGQMASKGKILDGLLKTLNDLEYYNDPYPKSLANSFGTDVVFPILSGSGETNDLLRTYVEHIAIQVSRSVKSVLAQNSDSGGRRKLLVTGGGAHNSFLIERLKELIDPYADMVAPDNSIIDFKEAIIMALIGILRWREENNVLASVTGSSRDSIGGAVWMGQEA